MCLNTGIPKKTIIFHLGQIIAIFPLVNIFSNYISLYYQGCHGWKNKVLISTDSVLIWTDNTRSVMVFLCLPSRKVIALHDRSKFTTGKSCKWCLWPWKYSIPHQKKADVVMLFLSQCVNNRCQTENNNISRHLWNRQLEMNVSQKILSKIHCILSVWTHKAQSNSKLAPVSCLWLPFYQESPRDVTAANSLILVTGKPISTNQASDIKPICCGDVTRCRLPKWRRRRLDLLGFLIRMSLVSINRIRCIFVMISWDTFSFNWGCSHSVPRFQ